MRVLQMFRSMSSVVIGLFATNSWAVDLSPREAQVLAVICAECHSRAETTAPVMGDTNMWRERNAQGFEVLVRNTVLGKGSMPPLGTCGYCTEAEIRHLVEALSGLADSGASP